MGERAPPLLRLSVGFLGGFRNTVSTSATNKNKTHKVLLILHVCGIYTKECSL